MSGLAAILERCGRLLPATWEEVFERERARCVRCGQRSTVGALGQGSCAACGAPGSLRRRAWTDGRLGLGRLLSTAAALGLASIALDSAARAGGPSWMGAASEAALLPVFGAALLAIVRTSTARHAVLRAGLVAATGLGPAWATQWAL